MLEVKLREVRWGKAKLFDACCISVAWVSAPKGLKVVLNIKNFFSSKWNISMELRYVWLRYDKPRKFGLKLELEMWAKLNVGLGDKKKSKLSQVQCQLIGGR